MSRARQFLLVVAGVVISLVGAAYWLAGSDGGTRWILARAKAYFPAELSIGDAQGSFLRGLRVEFVEWSGESLRISARDIYLDVKLLPLFFRHVAANELNASAFAIDIPLGNPEASDREPGLPRVDLPIGLSIAEGNLEGVSVRIGTFDQAADHVQISGSLFGSDLNITRFVFDGSRFGVDLDGRVRMAGGWPGRARIAWRWQRSDTLAFAGNLQMQGDTRRYDLQHVLTEPQTLSTSGDISYESGILQADLTNEWQDLDWPIGVRRLQSSGGSLLLQGGLDAYAVELDAQARLDDFPDTQLELSGDADLQSIRISSLHAVNEFGDLTGSGTARWLPEQSFDMDVSLSGLDPGRILDAMSGTLALDGGITGRFSDAPPQLELRIDRITGDVNGHALDGRANLSLANETLSIADGRIVAGSNRLTVNGVIGDSISMNAGVDLVALGELIPEASGSVSGRVALSGSRTRPDARLELTASALRYADFALDRFAADAALRQSASSSAELEFGQFSAGSFALDSARVSLSGTLADHDIRLVLDGYGSELETDMAGRLADDRWSARIDSLSLANPAIGQWSSNEPADLGVTADEVALSGTCLSGASVPGRACLSGRVHRDGSSSIDFSMLDLPLSAVPANLPGEVNLDGVVDAHVQLETRERRVSGHAGIGLRGAAIDATYDGEPVSVAFTDASGEATITDNRVESTMRLEIAGDAGAGDLHFSMQDLADRHSAIAGQGKLFINDASLFAVFLPGISNPHGKIEGDLTISGTLDEPVFLGEVALAGGAFAVRRAGIEIVDIEARLSQRAAGRLQLTGSARSGGGRLSIEGDTRVGGETGIRTEILLSGENFELIRLPDWQVAASPSITVVFDERQTLISGDLGIPMANITVRDIPETAESPSPDAVVHRGEDTQAYTGRRLRIDVTTMLGDNVHFSGFGLTAALDGKVRLQGGSDSPWVGTGTLILRDGRYKAYGQELVIERGELLFNGPLDNPQLDVRATRQANDVVAGINLTGTPTQLRSMVFSEPAMSDAEALSYLLTGRPLATSSAGEGDVLNNAAFALGLTGAGRIASQMQSELGLETLTVEGGSDSGRIVAGKRIGNRLLVEYGYGLVDKLGTLLLRYQLTDRIVLESRTGTVSVFDIVYSVKKQ